MSHDTILHEKMFESFNWLSSHQITTYKNLWPPFHLWFHPLLAQNYHLGLSLANDFITLHCFGWRLIIALYVDEKRECRFSRGMLICHVTSLQVQTSQEYLVMMHYGEYNWPQLFTINYMFAFTGYLVITFLKLIAINEYTYLLQLALSEPDI